MSREYDLFERFPDGSSLWRACAIGLQSAHDHMLDMARRSPNLFYAINLATGKRISQSFEPGKLDLPPKMGKKSHAAAA